MAVMPTRKYHHKSTTGCAECKNARVKCDETKPECTRCSRQGRPCSYARQNNAPSPASSSGGAQGNPDDYVPLLQYKQDMELLHHYSTYAFRSLNTDELILRLWQHTAVKQALKYPFLLRAIFSFTALHLSTTLPKTTPSASGQSNANSPFGADTTSPMSGSADPASPPDASQTSNDAAPTAPKPAVKEIKTSAEWYERAVADYGQALLLARPELEDLNEKNCHAALLFSSLIANIRLAMPQVTGDYGHDGVLGYILESFHLLRGKAAISQAAYAWVMTGPLKGAINDRQVREPRDIPPAILIVLEGFEQEAASLINPSSDPAALQRQQDRQQAYHLAIAGVRAYFACQPGDAAAVRIASAWPVRIPAPFVAELWAREPLALAILAYYAVMLDDQREHWWMGDTGRQLLLHISETVGSGWSAALGPAREQMELEIDHWAQVASLKIYDEGEGGSHTISGIVNAQNLPEDGIMGQQRQNQQMLTPSHSQESTPYYPDLDPPSEDDGQPAQSTSIFGVSLSTGGLPGQTQKSGTYHQPTT